VAKSIEGMVNKAEFLSQKLLFKAKAGEAVDEYVKEYAEYDEARLFAVLSTDEHKLAFWINTYNAFSILYKRMNSNDARGKDSIAGKKINVAGNVLSLADIEQRILLCYRAKGLKAYMNSMFNSAFERRFRLEKLEKMVYFALNNGSDHCPPVHFYESFKIYDQLKLATREYLKEHIHIDMQSELVLVPELIKNNLADFRGKAGVISFLKKHKAIPSNMKVNLIFKRTLTAELV